MLSSRISEIFCHIYVPLNRQVICGCHAERPPTPHTKQRFIDTKFSYGSSARSRTLGPPVVQYHQITLGFAVSIEVCTISGRGCTQHTASGLARPAGRQAATAQTQQRPHMIHRKQQIQFSKLRSKHGVSFVDKYVSRDEV